MNVRIVLAGWAVMLGLLAAVAGSPEPRSGTRASLAMLASEIEHERDHVTALELAQWIREKRPGLRVIDVRPDSEYQLYHVPTAQRLPLARLATTSFRASETLVLYSEGGGHAAQGWVLLRTAGVRNVYFLRGGILEWMDNVMNPAASSDLTRYFGGVARSSPAVPITGRVTDAARRIRRRSC